MFHYGIVFHCARVVFPTINVCVYSDTVFVFVSVFISWHSHSCSLLFFCIFFAFTLIVADSFFHFMCNYTVISTRSVELCRGIVLLLLLLYIFVPFIQCSVLQSQNLLQNNAKYHRERMSI